MKNDKVLRKIGEVSKDLDLPIHVIRFWEKKIAVLKPIKTSNGIRYFDKNQMTLLKEIKSLLYEKKFSIEGANLILKEKKNNHNERKKLLHELEELINELKSRI